MAILGYLGPTEDGVADSPDFSKADGVWTEEKPTCPFCDVSRVGQIEIVQKGGMFAAKCNHCFAVGPTASEALSAFNKWHNRP